MRVLGKAVSKGSVPLPSLLTAGAAETAKGGPKCFGGDACCKRWHAERDAGRGGWKVREEGRTARMRM